MARTGQDESKTSKTRETYQVGDDNFGSLARRHGGGGPAWGLGSVRGDRDICLLRGNPLRSLADTATGGSDSLSSTAGSTGTRSNDLVKRVVEVGRHGYARVVEERRRDGCELRWRQRRDRWGVKGK